MNVGDMKMNDGNDARSSDVRKPRRGSLGLTRQLVNVVMTDVLSPCALAAFLVRNMADSKPNLM